MTNITIHVCDDAYYYHLCTIITTITGWYTYGEAENHIGRITVTTAVV